MFYKLPGINHVIDDDFKGLGTRIENKGGLVISKEGIA